MSSNIGLEIKCLYKMHCGMVLKFDNYGEILLSRINDRPTPIVDPYFQI